MSHSAQLRLYAVVDTDLYPWPLPEGASGLHDAFDDLPVGVYTGLRTFRGRSFFRLDDHLDRLQQGLDLQGSSYRLDREALGRALDAAATDFGGPDQDAGIRIEVLSRDVGVDSHPRKACTRLAIALAPLVRVPERFRSEGVRVDVAHGLERHEPIIKHSEFVRRRRPYPLAREDSYEHLLVDDAGRILECTSANFYAVIDGVLRTAETGMLEGITRKHVLRLAAELEIPVELRAPTLDELPSASEAFLTSSTRGVLPVVAAAGVTIGTGTPGPHTRALATAYVRRSEGEAKPAWPRT